MIKKIYFINILLISLTACSGFKEAGKVLRNEKIRTTDEFLVKKRNPLVLPPNYEEVIKPGEILKKKQEQEDDIKKLLKAVETKDDKKPPSSITSPKVFGLHLPVYQPTGLLPKIFLILFSVQLTTEDLLK